MKKLLGLHPFFFALFPILSLYAYNLGSASLFESAMPSLWMTGLFMASLWWVFNRILKDPRKGTILTSLFLLIFFSYGHVASQFQLLILGDVVMRPLFQHAILMILVLLTPIGLTFSFLKRRGPVPESAIKFFFLLGFLLVTVPIIRIGSYLLIHKEISPPKEEIQFAARPIQNLPDIYYIILDGYARGDILKWIILCRLSRSRCFCWSAAPIRNGQTR